MAMFVVTIDNDEKVAIEQLKMLFDAEELVQCKECMFAAPDMCCNHPIEWDNGESRNHCNPEFYCMDGKQR